MPLDYMGYKVQQINKNLTRITASLVRQKESGFPNDIQNVSVEITSLNDKSLRIRVTDNNKHRYEPSIPQLNLPDFPIAMNPLYTVDVDRAGRKIIRNKIFFIQPLNIF